MNLKQETVIERPAGSTAVVIGAVLILLRKFTGVDFTADESVALVTIATALVSLLSPRFRQN